jgi:thiol-disulfide isomerase/thioredoxin
MSFFSSQRGSPYRENALTWRYFEALNSETVMDLPGTEQSHKQEVQVLKFTATWCGPCRACSPAVKALAIEFPNVKISEVDVDRDEKQTEYFNVTSMPTFVILQDGQEVHRVIGANVQNVRSILLKLQAEKHVLESLAAAVAAGCLSSDERGKEESL